MYELLPGQNAQEALSEWWKDTHFEPIAGFVKPSKGYKKQTVPENFTNNDETLLKCSALIESMLEQCQSQDEFDAVYLNFLQIYYEEMAKFLKEAKSAPKSAKSLRFTKNLTGALS